MIDLRMRHGAQIAAVVLVAMTCLLVLGAGMIPISRKVSLNGTIQPIGGLAEITSPESGVVAGIFVQESDSVLSNQVIAHVTRSKFRAEKSEQQRLAELIQERLAALKTVQAAQSKRHREAVAKLQESIRLYRLQLLNLESQISVHENLQMSVRRIYQSAQSLSDKGFYSSTQLAAAKENMLQSEARALEVGRQLLEAKALLATAEADKERIGREAEIDLARTHAEVASTKQLLVSSDATELVQVRSARSGKVSGVTRIVGQEVQQGAIVATIVPENAKQTAVLLANAQQVVELKEGQAISLALPSRNADAAIYFSTIISKVDYTPVLPSQLIGQATGGLASNEPVFRVYTALAMDSADRIGGRITLRPGLSITGDVHIRRQSIFSRAILWTQSFISRASM